MAERHEAMKVIDRFSSIRSVSEECSLLLEEATNNLRAIDSEQELDNYKLAVKKYDDFYDAVAETDSTMKTNFLIQYFCLACFRESSISNPMKVRRLPPRQKKMPAPLSVNLMIMPPLQNQIKRNPMLRLQRRPFQTEISRPQRP